MMERVGNIFWKWLHFCRRDRQWDLGGGFDGVEVHRAIHGIGVERDLAQTLPVAELAW
jgi:hypothetical protein